MKELDLIVGPWGFWTEKAALDYIDEYKERVGKDSVTSWDIERDGRTYLVRGYGPAES